MNFRSSTFYRRSAALAVTAAAAVALSACGGDDKPAFCADRDNFQKSIEQIPGLLTDGNLSGLQTQLNTIETEAGTLAESAKSDFPQETDAVESSVNSLRQSYDQLPKDPSSTELAGLALQAATAISAVKNFNSATNSDCE